MDLINILAEELKGFFSLEGIVNIIQSGEYSSLRTWDGITKAISPLIPLILILEISTAFLTRKIQSGEYRIPFLIYVFNRFTGRFISFGVVAFCIGWLQPMAFFKFSWTWYGFLLGYIAWEFAHFIYHFLAHKVRLFWCLHSTHHAPEHMNLSVTYAHFLLEAPYADFIRTSICMLAGVPPEMLFVIMFIDGTWGAFIHVGANLIKDASLGWFGKMILTPSHHRVHHARNPLYMDTNFCNLLNLWDHIFKTYQPEKKEINIEYGITRTINANNFWDVYFGEIYHLVKDVIQAPGIRNKLMYVIMPPGWSPDGNHKTASAIRKDWLMKQS
ncbi:MAG: sterol desaturase family protein [Bacteroidetes bacterium]|nr:sterol desaturase family protein [Bacteroidota bacterium]